MRRTILPALLTTILLACALLVPSGCVSSTATTQQALQTNEATEQILWVGYGVGYTAANYYWDDGRISPAAWTSTVAPALNALYTDIEQFHTDYTTSATGTVSDGQTANLAMGALGQIIAAAVQPSGNTQTAPPPVPVQPPPAGSVPAVAPVSSAPATPISP